MILRKNKSRVNFFHFTRDIYMTWNGVDNNYHYYRALWSLYVPSIFQRLFGHWKNLLCVFLIFWKIFFAFSCVCLLNTQYYLAFSFMSVLNIHTSPARMPSMTHPSHWSSSFFFAYHKLNQRWSTTHPATCYWISLLWLDSSKNRGKANTNHGD